MSEPLLPNEGWTVVAEPLTRTELTRALVRREIERILPEGRPLVIDIEDHRVVIERWRVREAIEELAMREEPPVLLERAR